MTVRFLKNCNAPQSYTHYCGDGCCSDTRWETVLLIAGEECEALAEAASWAGTGIVDLSSLVYKEDYEIIVFP